MNQMKTNTYTKNKKLTCNWIDKKNYLIQYRTLEFHVGQAMVVDKVHELTSFNQSIWLKNYLSFNTQK